MEQFLIGMFAGIVLTVIVGRWILIRATARAEQQIEQMVQAIQALSVNQVQARVEEDNGVFYVYRADDNTFLAQGTTMAELRERIESRMKDAMVCVTEGDPEVLARLKATGTEVTHA
jgi:lipopolysaccharide export LptBFGC system permease protein LptF